MKRVATVGAKFCKSHKFVSSPTSSFSSLSDLAEHHGIIENNEGVVIPSSNESSGLSPRKLRHAATCDDLSNVFENLSLEDEATTSSSMDLYNDETISNSSLLSTTTTTTTLSNTSNNNNCTIDSKEAAELEEESSIASAPIPVTVTRVSKKTRVQKKKVTKSVIPPQSDENKGKKTIVLDLDETLIKSFYQEPEVFDFAIDIEFPHMGSLIQQHVYIKKRPGLEDFLQTLVEKFELIIFTAALPVYADAILKHIDPSAKLFSHVLYRHHCNGSGMFPGKDLRILGRNLDHTLLVDDGVMNFLQPKNGLLIKSFKGEESDRMLTDVIAPFLLQLDDPDRTVYEIIDKYRKFIAVTTSFDLADTIERSHYSYYLNISSTSKTLYSVSY